MYYTISKKLDNIVFLKILEGPVQSRVENPGFASSLRFSPDLSLHQFSQSFLRRGCELFLTRLTPLREKHNSTMKIQTALLNLIVAVAVTTTQAVSKYDTMQCDATQPAPHSPWKIHSLCVALCSDSSSTVSFVSIPRPPARSKRLLACFTTYCRLNCSSAY